MIQIITQKCPSCKYIYREKHTCKKYPWTEFTKIKPARNTIQHYPSHAVRFSLDETNEDVYVCVSNEVLNGDEPFRPMGVVNHVNDFRAIGEKELTVKRTLLIVCPKCGTVLDSHIASFSSEEFSPEEL